jgi:hypothetical protein
VFFSYVNLTLGGGFVAANMGVLIYLWIFWGSLSSEKNAHEVKMNENEKFIIDILNNHSHKHKEFYKKLGLD